MPKEIVSYSNRALCYLKLNQAEKALADCNSALKINKNHVKALFRRAQANKMLRNYKDSLADLATVLKTEPSNNAAKKEMEECKAEFADRLRIIQNENEAAKQQNKNKLTTKVGKCPLAKEPS